MAAADFTDTPPVLDGEGTNLSWTANGDSGLVLDCYCKIAPQTPTSNYTVLQRCRLSFATNGTLAHAELLPERIRIRASCQTNMVSRFSHTNISTRISGLLNTDRAKPSSDSTASKIQ